MPQSSALTYDDPMPYQAAIRAGDVEVSVIARGDFRGKLIKIDLQNLWMQSGWENLPRVIQASVSPKRTGIQFLADARQPALQLTGVELHPKAIAALQPASTYQFRSQSPCRWPTMSLTPETFRAVSAEIMLQFEEFLRSDFGELPTKLVDDGHLRPAKSFGLNVSHALIGFADNLIEEKSLSAEGSRLCEHLPERNPCVIYAATRALA